MEMPGMSGRMPAAMVASLIGMVAAFAAHAQQSINPDEVRAISREGYSYGFPLVDNYRIQYAYFVDRQNPEFKVPWNQIGNLARVATPNDKAIQTPNSDTTYSFVGMNLRAEPMVLTALTIGKERYYSIQLIDAYTHNFDHIGSRARPKEEALKGQWTAPPLKLVR